MNIPNPKSQTPKKSQAPNWNSCEVSLWNLDFEFWRFFRIWDLGFGVS
jgi:hypothetical protein